MTLYLYIACNHVDNINFLWNSYDRIRTNLYTYLLLKAYLANCYQKTECSLGNIEQ